LIRFLMLTLMLNLSITHPSFALRTESALEASGLEERLTNALKPSSPASTSTGLEEIHIEKGWVWNQHPDFLAAIDYFNERVLSAPSFNWDHFVELFRLFRGEPENDDMYMQRTNALANGKGRLSNLLSEINSQTQSISDQEVVQKAVKLYWKVAVPPQPPLSFMICEQLLHRCSRSLHVEQTTLTRV